MKSIEINYRTSSGYETLYPQTNSDLVTYNSQTLTQVINQQNSDITGLQGQVGDSEVGVTIPKVMEYHLGGGSWNSVSGPVIFSQGMSFPLNGIYLIFTFNNLQTNDVVNYVTIEEVPSSTANPLAIMEGPVSISLARISFGFNLFCGPNNLGNGDTSKMEFVIDSALSGSHTGNTRSVISCRMEDNKCYINNNWQMYITRGTLSYSSLDIRIYYYD